METKLLGDGDYNAGVVIGVIIAVFVAVVIFFIGLPEVASDNNLREEELATSTEVELGNDYTPTGEVPTSTVVEM